MPNQIIYNGKKYSGNYPTDLRNNVVTFDSEDTAEPTAWTDMPLLESNSRVKTLMGKISIAFKNLRYLAKMIGSADISAIGDGTVTGALTQLNGNIHFEEISVININRDLNNLPLFKFVKFDFSLGGQISNKPSTSYAGIVYCIPGYSGYVQIAIYYEPNTAIHHIRKYYGPTGWGAWFVYSGTKVS